jgi:2-polyprenyl-3-methyl-5-hydroxy-6-metoxy-1,4-benzoquinol methylase
MDAGTVMISPLVGRPVVLSRHAFAYLAAFGAGASPDTAAGEAPLPGGVSSLALASAFVEAGLLEPCDATDSAPEPDVRNVLSQRFFERYADHWLADAYAEEASDSFARQRVDIALRWLASLGAASPYSVIDIGCGGGHLVQALARRGYRVHGVDASPAMIAACRARLADLASEDRARVTLECSDAVSASRELGPVDAVAALGVLPWFDEPVRLLSWCRRQLCRGGHLIVSCANKGVTDAGALWLMAPELLRDNASLLLDYTRRYLDDNKMLWDDGVLLSLSVEAVCRALRQDTPVNDRPRVSHCGEKRLLPSEVVAAAQAAGFNVLGLVGTGNQRTHWDHILPGQVANALNGPLAALRCLPLSALWSTGFMALLRAY